MYHFTSGRMNFISLSPFSADMIQEILAFQFKDVKDPNPRTIPELQRSIRKAQNILISMEGIRDNTPPDSQSETHLSITHRRY